MRCPVCGKGQGTCTSHAYVPPEVPDLLNEGGPYVMAKTDNTLRMPKQHVRPGRGTVGYKSTDEGKVVEVPTADPYAKGSSARKSKADWQAEATDLGIAYDETTTVAQLKAAIKEATGE